MQPASLFIVKPEAGFFMQSSGFSTAIATAAHAAELVQLINSAYRGPTSRQGWTTEADILEGIRIDEQGIYDIIANPHADLHLFQDQEGLILGCVYLENAPDYLYLGMLVVRPGMQGGGMGKKILQYAEEAAARLHKKCIRMTVIHTRTELIDWYKRHGYLPTGETEPWDDTLHIGKRKIETITFIVLEKKLGNTGA